MNVQLNSLKVAARLDGLWAGLQQKCCSLDSIMQTRILIKFHIAASTACSNLGTKCKHE